MPGILIDGVVAVKFATPMQVISNQPVFAMDTVSLKRVTNSQDAHRWEIKTALAPTNNGYDFFIHSVINGYNTPFDIRMPQVYRGEGIYTQGEFTATGAAGASIVAYTGGAVPKGEFVKFSSHDKVYMVTANSNGSSLSIFPKLKTAINGAMFAGDNVVFKAKYDPSTILGMAYQNGILGDPGTVTFIEA